MRALTSSEERPGVPGPQLADDGEIATRKWKIRQEDETRNEKQAELLGAALSIRSVPQQDLVEDNMAARVRSHHPTNLKTRAMSLSSSALMWERGGFCNLIHGSDNSGAEFLLHKMENRTVVQ